MLIWLAMLPCLIYLVSPQAVLQGRHHSTITVAASISRSYHQHAFEVLLGRTHHCAGAVPERWFIGAAICESLT